MSSASNITNHRLHPSKECEPRCDEWELYVSPLSGFIYIVGPGPTAMLRAYRRPTVNGMEIVRAAVVLLRQTRREDAAAGPAEIREAMIACGWEEEP